jgi:hypothetical protein
MNIPRVLLTTLATLGLWQAQASAQLSEDFEKYKVGASLHGQGGWVAQNIDADAAVTISADRAYTGARCLQVRDDSATQRPRAVFALPVPLSRATIKFAVREDQTDDGTGDRWSAYFGTFRIDRTQNQLVLNYSGGGEGTIASPRVKNLADFPAYSTTDWNVITVTVDKSGGIAVSINGKAPFSLLVDPAYNWSIDRFEVSTSSRATTGDVVYFDTISITNTR